jgi:hypothetical protein
MAGHVNHDRAGQDQNVVLSLGNLHAVTGSVPHNRIISPLWFPAKIAGVVPGEEVCACRVEANVVAGGFEILKREKYAIVLRPALQAEGLTHTSPGQRPGFSVAHQPER